jgi:phosphonate transport system ATP-binding protein
LNLQLDGAGLVHRTGTRALGGVSLQVAAGEHVALLGPSGAGKTTLLSLLNATLRATEGRVLADGQDVARLSHAQLRTLRRRIGTVFQLPPLVPTLTALQNALCGRLAHWSLFQAARQLVLPSRVEEARAREVLAAVGLAGREESLAAELSGGQQQRVAIARALLQEPEVLLADEPFASLDPGLTLSLSELLFEQAAKGRTLVAALHDVDLALRCFPRIVGVEGGVVQFDLPRAQVTDALLGRLYAQVRTAAPGPAGEHQEAQSGLAAGDALA